MSHLIVLTSMPDIASAEQLADELIDASLAACVNILPAMQSIYDWQGKRHQAKEHQLIIKTSNERYAELENMIKKRHPYTLPEIISIPVQRGLPAYLAWITESTRENDEPDL